MKFPSDDDEHVYELKKARMSQSKDGYHILFLVHPEDADSDAVRAPVGSVFKARMKFLNYVEIP